MWILASYIIVLVGGINWLLVGLLQYDFVAGIFGFQSSLLSRIVYIVVGAATIFLIFNTIIQKGNLRLFNFEFKRKPQKVEEPKLKVESKEPQKSSELNQEDPKEAPEYPEDKTNTHGSLNDFNNR